MHVRARTGAATLARHLAAAIYYTFTFSSLGRRTIAILHRPSPSPQLPRPCNLPYNAQRPYLQPRIRPPAGPSLFIVINGVHGYPSPISHPFIAEKQKSKRTNELLHRTPRTQMSHVHPLPKSASTRGGIPGLTNGSTYVASTAPPRRRMHGPPSSAALLVCPPAQPTRHCFKVTTRRCLNQLTVLVFIHANCRILPSCHSSSVSRCLSVCHPSRFLPAGL